MISARVRAGTVLLFAFACGALAGIVFERHFSLRQPVAISLDEEQKAAMAELKELLDLDDQQVAQIHNILVERQQIVQQMWEQIRPEVQSAMGQVHQEIAQLLRADQRRRFHNWLLRHGGMHAPLPIN